MARKKKSATAYKGGHIRPTAFGTFKADLYIDGLQHRKTLKTRADAEAWIDDLRSSHMVGAPSLTPAETQDARAAIKMLPAGMGLSEVVRAWVRENAAPCAPVRACEALDVMIAEKVALGRRQRHTETLDGNVRRFLNDHDGVMVHEITAAQAKAWLTARGFSGATWNNYCRTFNNFMAWCVREGHIKANPLAGFPKSITREAPPICFSVEAARAFLYAMAIAYPELIPFFATGFFAGIRSAELDRMDATCFGPEYIHIGQQQAKIAHQRYVKILPNLRAWLDAFPPSGALQKALHRGRFERVRDSCMVDSVPFAWVPNGMRHSFASYHLAAFGNSASTAHEMGHHGPGLLFSKYRTLSMEQSGLDYFDIYPETSKK